MTKREAYLTALRGGRVDSLIWAPNFDYWLGVNTAEGTLPEKYRGMSRNDIVRSIGATLWNRAPGVKEVLDPSVKRVSRAEGLDHVTELITPVGTIRQVHRIADGPHRSRSLSEHFVKDLDCLRVMTYVAEATHYEPDYQPATKALEDTGDDGVVLNMAFSIPFIQFAKTDAGYVNGYYMWVDHREEVDSLIRVYHRKFLEAYTVLADGPADVISTGDNMDGVMISPDVFRQYAIPFYQELGAITRARGKILEAHWCGRTQNLLPLTPGCGLDVVEAIVTQPMADITLPQALDLLRGEVTLQGGIPSVLVCEQGATREAFDRYIEEAILPLQGRPGFILGMSDNVPPNADFSRVEAVAELIG